METSLKSEIQEGVIGACHHIGRAQDYGKKQDEKLNCFAVDPIPDACNQGGRGNSCKNQHRQIVPQIIEGRGIQQRRTVHANHGAQICAQLCRILQCENCPTDQNQAHHI